MENHKLGTFASWEIISSELIVKHCDKSFFDHHGSGIPIETRWFWDAEQLQHPNRINILLQYNGSDYKAYLEQDIHNRTRIFWFQDLAKEFNSLIFEGTNYPDLYIYKRDSYYEISFHNFPIIQNDNFDLESIITESHKEGRVIKYYTTKYERNPKNRQLAISVHGTKCMACGFDFEKTYGKLGKDFIEVHHVVPLSDRNEEVDINPKTDLICLCANCHRMIHRHRDSILTLDELKEILNKQKSKE